MLQRLTAEFIGTAGLLAAVVGSGIMAERIAGGNAAIALLANTVATGAALAALILAFGPISAHFNPVVSMSAALNRDSSWGSAISNSVVQVLGALVGVGAANAMFDLPFFFASPKVRTGFSQWLAEFIATFGLVGVIIAVDRRHNIRTVAAAVAAYITAAYWFTSSTSFANPAVTLARAFSDTFAGIRLADVPAFIAAQLLGAIAAALLFNWLVPKQEKE